MRSIFIMPSDDLPSNEVRGRYIIIPGGIRYGKINLSG